MLERNQLDTAHVAEVIRQQFPDVSPVTVTYLGEGCDSSAFEVNSQWVFRFPKRADVEQQLLLEFRVLPVLYGKLGFQDYQLQLVKKLS